MASRMLADGSDELTKCFSEALFERFPAWRSFAKPVKEKSGKVAIEVRVPQEGSDRFLYLATVDDEITIGFDQWHTHVGPFLGIDLDESVATALGIIEDFVAEETVAVVLERNGAWVESSLEYRAAPSARVADAKTKMFSGTALTTRRLSRIDHGATAVMTESSKASSPT